MISVLDRACPRRCAALCHHADSDGPHHRGDHPRGGYSVRGALAIECVWRARCASPALEVNRDRLKSAVYSG